MLHAVIMAGGSGVRFWPESRRAKPKQFLSLAGDESLLAQTAQRVAGWIPADATWVVTGQSLAESTARELSELPKDQVIIEPCPRNTAGCIALAAVELLHRDPDAMMLVMPADHAISSNAEFRTAVERAVRIIEKEPDTLVLFGVAPDHPATQFGYIRRCMPWKGTEAKAFGVKSFHEKPDRETAEKYLAADAYYWNSGIFVWRADQIIAELAKFEPEIHRSVEKLRAARGGNQWNESLRAEFAKLKSISIDRAVLERAEHACVIEAPFAWDDVGSWQSLARSLQSDAAGNAVDGPFCGLDTANCIVRTTPDHLVATIGLQDFIVVHTPDATLIARRDDENAIRELVEKLEELGYERFL